MVSSDMASELPQNKGKTRNIYLDKLKDISIKVTIEIVNNAHELFSMHNVMNKKGQKVIRMSFRPLR